MRGWFSVCVFGWLCVINAFAISMDMVFVLLQCVTVNGKYDLASVT